MSFQINDPKRVRGMQGGEICVDISPTLKTIFFMDGNLFSLFFSTLLIGKPVHGLASSVTSIVIHDSIYISNRSLSSHRFFSIPFTQVPPEAYAVFQVGFRYTLPPIVII